MREREVMRDESSSSSGASPAVVHIAVRAARLILVAFLFTFLAARMIVLLIMTRRIPDLYLHLGGTHVHHFNYGIFFLVGVGAYLLFARPIGRRLSAAAVLYGIGLGLTFDEFGMWLHLGGAYWQRASFDAVVVVATLLGLIAYAPSLQRIRPKHWLTALALAICLTVFIVLAIDAAHQAGQRLAPRLHEIEADAPR